MWCVGFFFFFQAEDGIRDLVRSRGLGDVYKRQTIVLLAFIVFSMCLSSRSITMHIMYAPDAWGPNPCLLYTSDAADERSSVDLGGRRIIKKKNKHGAERSSAHTQYQLIKAT